MGWFGIGGISDKERQAIWHKNYQKNQIKEQRRAELRRNFDEYLVLELSKLYKKLGLPLKLELNFKSLVVIEELWAKVLGNGDIKNVPSFIIQYENTEEIRRACKTFKYHEIASMNSFSHLLLKDFIKYTETSQKSREKQLNQELESLTLLLTQVQNSHQIISKKGTKL